MVLITRLNHLKELHGLNHVVHVHYVHGLDHLKELLASSKPIENNFWNFANALLKFCGFAVSFNNTRRCLSSSVE